MKLTDKYISTTGKALSPGSQLIVLSDDAYAICEFIEYLKDTLHTLRFIKHG